MSAVIFDVPVRFKNTVPDIFQNQDKYQELEDKWLEDLQAWIKKNFRGGKYIGRTIRFGVADGSAQYMVMKLGAKPELIHLPLMDAYQFEYAHLMTATEIKKKIDGEDRFDELMKAQCNVGEVNEFLEDFADEVVDDFVLSNLSRKLMMENHICIKWSNPINNKGKVEYFVKKDNSFYGEQEKKVFNYLQKSFLV